MRFVDTSFWIGLQVARDAHHQAARAFWLDTSHALITANYVLGETWTFLRRRAGHQHGLVFLERVAGSQRVTVVCVDEETEREAWTWLRRHDERVCSFVDATSFALMRRRGLLEALAFDGDFSAAGFVEVRP